MLTLQLHRAIEARAAVVALKKIVIPIFPVLVLLAATYSVPVHSARRNLHLVHFFSAYRAAMAFYGVVLSSGIGAVFTLPAVRVQPRGWTVIVLVGPCD